MNKKQNEAVSIARESNTTWDIIAELSKQATTDVHTMLLRHFYSSASEEPTDDAAESSINVPLSRYMSYPAADIKELFTSLKMTKFMEEFAVNDGGEREESGEKKDKKHKNKNKNKNKNKKGGADGAASKKDQIRQDQVKVHAAKAADFFAKRDRATLNPNFRSNVVEVIVLYYLNVTHHTYTKKIIAEFMNAVLSLRDAFVYFEANLNPFVKQIVRSYFVYIQQNFPWQSLLSGYTRFLLNNHFKHTFQRAPKPFPEQAKLLDSIKATDAHRLYVLPWGVGTGKTAMLPPLTEIYRQVGYQTLYCVPFGPVRDQAAALLYRCGIPFAYVVPSVGGTQEEFELQPSFMCGEGVVPVAYIVHPEFVQYYIQYWQSYEELVDGNAALMDPRQNPPSVMLPNAKARYAHLTHAIWNPNFALALDEPSDSNPHMQWILNRLPETTFVMSATSWSLVSESVRQNYVARFEKQPITIEAQTVGVSTTLIGSWGESRAVLSPFSGIRTRAAFRQRLDFIKDKILWRRFLSAEVMVDWIRRSRQTDERYATRVQACMAYDFDLYTLSFDSLSERILEWCERLERDDRLDDGFYGALLAFEQAGGAVAQQQTPAQRLEAILTRDSYRFLGGCIIGVPDVGDTYPTISHLLSTFPSVEEVDRRIEKYRKETAERYAEWKRFPITKQTDLIKKHEKLKELENKRQSSLPIPEELIVNTGAYIEAQTGRPAPATTKLTRVQETVETGDPLQDVDGWQVTADKMKGNFDVENEEELLWRWKGVGGITMHKEFNMKNIRDSDAGYLAFLLVDAVGAHGLNLKIKHGILMKGEDGSMLTPETCFQMAGRVGRWGQDSTGFVYVTDQDIFDSVFAH
jgi:hypothetical protein